MTQRCACDRDVIVFGHRPELHGTALPSHSKWCGYSGNCARADDENMRISKYGQAYCRGCGNWAERDTELFH